MDVQNKETPATSDPHLQEKRFFQQKAISQLWKSLGLLIRWRWFIVGITALGAIISIVLSLMMPNWYAASSRLLSPESSGTNPLSAALASNLSSAASAILGRSGGDYLRYKTILSSRTMYERVVDEFDLVTVYEMGESESPRDAAIRTLAENVAFPIDDEDEFLSVVVLDTDPERAADMTNFFVAELNKRNSELAALDAANYRIFVEERYAETRSTLNTLKDKTQAFQELHGVFDLESQTASFLEQVASIRGEAIALEIEYQALLSQYGPGNPRVQIAKSAYEAANRKSREALQGREDILPVSQEDFPEVIREYIELEQDMLIQKSILEIIAPMYEQARFQEERKYEAVQVVDKAVPPVKKAKPRRSIIVIGATLSAFLIAVIFVLLFDWWKRIGPSIIQRLNEEVAGQR